MWRQGDVFIAAIASIPSAARRQTHGVLVEGEATGHSHRVEDLDTAEVFQGHNVLYVRVRAESARIVHQEHGPIALPRGSYRVWKQREFAPEAIRWVAD
jgi:hypothetical protein